MATKDIGQNAMMAKFKALKLAMVAETMMAVDNTCSHIETYAKLTHGIQGGNPTQPGKNVFQNRTFDLETSIHHDTPKINGTFISGNVIADMPYASDVEHGTSTSRPYPFMKPSVEASSRLMPIELSYALERAKLVIK